VKLGTLLKLAAVLSAIVLMSGCSVGIDVETLLRPPRPTGEQKEIQKALEKYIYSEQKNQTPDAFGGYILKYPRSGDYRSAFVMKDLNGDGVDEAIVFYSYRKENINVHLNLLRKNDNQWESVSDIEGASPDIDRVEFGDLNGDGLYEVITGWNIDNVSNRLLVLFDISSGALHEWYRELYTEYVIDGLTTTGWDDLLILLSNKAENVTTARLLQSKKGKDSVLHEVGFVRLDGYIQQFSNPVATSLTDTIKGVFVDGTRNSGGMVTELIYWDGKHLRAPFYDRSKNKNDLTYREALLPSMDIDGDGLVEWPITKSVIGYKNSDTDNVWYTKWYGWDINTQKVKEVFSCIINMTDGYYLKIDNEWDGMFTLSYDRASRTMSIYSLSDGKAGERFLMLKAVYKTKDEKAFESDLDQPEFRLLEDLTDVKFFTWFSDKQPFNLNLEHVSYRFTYLH
jgi:hypothetical protein